MFFIIRTSNPDFLKEKTGIKPVLLFMIKLNYIKIIQYTIHDKLYYFLLLLLLLLLLYITNYTNYTQYTLPVTNLLAVAVVGVFSHFLVLIIR